MMMNQVSNQSSSKAFGNISRKELSDIDMGSAAMNSVEKNRFSSKIKGIPLGNLGTDSSNCTEEDDRQVSSNKRSTIPDRESFEHRGGSRRSIQTVHDPNMY